MKHNYQLIEKLPPLAWCAVVEGNQATILHGKGVECKDDFFVEGAWNGTFGKGDFLESDWFSGTGGYFDDKGVTFSTPTHITFPLFSVLIDGKWYVSNSLQFLMAYNDLSLDADYLNYEVDFNTVCRGINKYKNYIEVKGQKGSIKVNIHYYRDVRIEDGNEICTIKDYHYAFTSFEDYENKLKAAMKGMIQNAQDEARNTKYGLAAMISKGYDSTGAATIAKELGCDMALTFSAKGKYAEDNGKELAQKLGYSTVVEKDADAYITRDDMVEAQYVASGELGVEISFSAFEDEYRNRLIFTGEGGDYIWDKNSDYRNSEIHSIKFTSALSNIERRLWVNYIPIPLPLYGAVAWPDLYEITNSEEMRPWALNNDYDRPIPRRIIESAGIPRESFGFEKRGAGFTYHFDWGGRIYSRMSKASGDSFKRFVDENHKSHPIQVIQFFVNTLPIYTNRIGITKKKIDVEKMSTYANPTLARYLFPWASKVMIEKYRKILQER